MAGAIDGRIGAAVRWSRATRADRQRQSDALLAGRMARFERQVDPDGVLSPEERRRRAEHASREQQLRASKAAAAARSARRKSPPPRREKP
jgi:hypothetical protein